jgi:DNA helicase II / ATP-dependent DNA helicase PcrA
MKAYFQRFDDRLTHRAEECFSHSAGFFEILRGPALVKILPKIREGRLAEVMSEVVAAPSLFKTLDILAKSFKGLRGMIGSLEEVVDGGVSLGRCTNWRRALEEGSTPSWIR